MFLGIIHLIQFKNDSAVKHLKFFADNWLRVSFGKDKKTKILPCLVENRKVIMLSITLFKKTRFQLCKISEKLVNFVL